MQHLSSRQRAGPQVHPVIDTLLRTCVYPSTLTLQIEHIIRTLTPHPQQQESQKSLGCVTKLFLTDGQLLIQALLHSKLSALPEIKDLENGDFVELHDYSVRKARRKNGQGHVVYIAIDECYVIKKEERAQRAVAGVSAQPDPVVLREQEASIPVHEHTVHNVEELEGGFIRGDALPNPIEVRQSQYKTGAFNTLDTLATMKGDKLVQHDTAEEESKQGLGHNLNSYQTPAKRKRALSLMSNSDEDDDKAFETVRVDLGTANKRRLILHELSQNLRSPPSRPPTTDSMGSPALHNNTTRPTLIRFDTGESIGTEHNEAMIAKGDQSQALNQDLGPAADHYDQSRTVLEPHHESSILSSEQKGSTARLDLPSSRQTTPLAPEFPTQSLLQGPFHNLSSLYSPDLPPKSYMFTTLIIPTYVATSLISRPNGLFPPKRHIKVIDPSLATNLNVHSKSTILNRGIIVAVYRNANDFKPTLGRVALMRGVVMQRLRSGSADEPSDKRTGEVILNVYPTKSRIQRYSQGQGQGQGQDRNTNQPNEIDARGVPGQQQSHLQSLNHAQSTAQNERAASQGAGTMLIKERVETDSDWFIDDHDLLRTHGFDVDTLQAWWDKIMDAGRTGAK